MSVSPHERQQLILEILAQMDSDDRRDDDDWDDDALAILVRKLGPKGPKGRSAVAVRPEVESDEIPGEERPGYLPPTSHDSFRESYRTDQ